MGKDTFINPAFLLFSKKKDFFYNLSCFHKTQPFYIFDRVFANLKEL